MSPARTGVRIVSAAAEHLPQVAAIYAEAARTTVATFDLDGPPMEHWQAKLDHQAAGDVFLVALDGEASGEAGEEAGGEAGGGVLGWEAGGEAGGGVLGFAYSGPFRPRPAYARTRETSIYLRADAQGQGLGRVLYSRLLDQLREADMHLAVAVVAQPNPASDALHLALGFTRAGTLDEVGFKLGAYVSTTWFQLRLG